MAEQKALGREAYDNVRSDGCVRYRINPVEAGLVQEIFERYANGEGLRLIAHAINARGVPTPRAQRGRPCGWDPGTIRAILHRPLYRGMIVWNRSKKRDSWGKKDQKALPESAWLRVEAPDLRIVSEELVGRVEARREGRVQRTAQGRKVGRGGRPGKYLLSGLMICRCGANYEAFAGPRGEAAYVCAARRRKGPAVCANDIMLTRSDMDDAVLFTLERVVFAKEFVESVLSTVEVDASEKENAALLAVEEKATKGT